MALKIRLRRMGRKKAPHYRIVVAESSMPRDGRFVARVGHYNPTTEPMTLVVDRDKALAWIAKGATPTDTVQALFRRAGVFGDAPTMVETVTDAAKKAGKAAASAASSAASSVAEKVSHAASAVAHAASDAVEAVKHAAEDVAERVTGADDEAPAAEAEAPAAEAETPAAETEAEPASADAEPTADAAADEEKQG